MRLTTYIMFGSMVWLSVLVGWPTGGAADDELAIQVVASPDAPSSPKDLHLVVQTEVKAMCLGYVFNEANPNRRAKFDLKNADREGKVKWVWPVDKKDSAGRWTLDLQCATTAKEGRIRKTLEFPSPTE